MRESDIAWAAGLFEGEGCIRVRKHVHHVELVLGMTDLDVVERFQSALGLGRISERPRRDQRHKRFWLWRACSTDEVRAVLQTIRPYLGQRRGAKADEALERLRDNPGARGTRTHCRRGHAYDEANTYHYVRDGYRSRQCRACQRINDAAARVKRRAAA